jgi:hypothetical protein
LTSVNDKTARRYDLGRMKRNGTVGALMLVCATTGQSIDTGVRYKKADLTRVKEAKLRLRCPHCHKYHVFSFADAKLRPILRGEKLT